ncbi:MAG: serine/threonine protein kinase [Alphaproteobacteria bacterium]|nr:serine/threonine protein kinase [Alphaproteobacteria bacterium]
MHDKSATVDAPNRELSGSFDSLGSQGAQVERIPRRRPPVRDDAAREDVAALKAGDLLGQTLGGRYVLEERLARGAMGCVYVARQLPFDRKVAVKVLDPKSQSDEASVFQERFLREASVLARLQHPNTVRVFDYGHHHGHTYLVMEYVDGSSVRRLQAGGPVPALRMIHIATQMCDALQEAHALGLIHRDLKPANVLLTRHAGALDVVKVVDFGLAKEFFGNADITQAGQVLGTPMYMAPEQIRDEPCDQRTDIYALGVVLYRGLTGVTPFEKGKAMAVLMAHLKKHVPRFAEVAPELELPPCVEWTVRTCLRKRSEDRFANVMELKRALRACALAIENPDAYDLELALTPDGCVVLPDDVCETTHTGLRLRAPAPELPSRPASPLDGVPARVAALLVGLSIVTGGLLGILAERLLP